MRTVAIQPANSTCQCETHLQDNETTAEYVENHDLPTTIFAGLDAMECDVNTSYTPDDLISRAEKAFKRLPSHTADIAITAMWLLYENICGCSYQKGKLREMMALCVSKMEEAAHS